MLLNEKQEICVIKSEKYGYMQLPGGGIEKDESILDGLERETCEETGFLIKDIKPLGFTVEKREDIRNTHEFDQDISYVFSALPDKEIGTNYMDDEIAEGFKPIWISLDDFIPEQEARGAGVASLFSPVFRATLGDKKRANARKFRKYLGLGAVFGT